MLLANGALLRTPVWAPKPPPPKRPRTERLTIWPGPESNFLLLNAAVLGVMVHFNQDEKRTLPCLGEHCWADHTDVGTRWQGWISALDLKTKVRGLLSVTPGLVEIEPKLVDPAVSLRGKVLRVGRKGLSKNGALRGYIVEEPHRHQVPAALPVSWHLRRMWQVDIAAPEGEEVDNG
jgi:hypothetical protein